MILKTIFVCLLTIVSIAIFGDQSSNDSKIDRRTIVKYVTESKNCEMFMFDRIVIVDGNYNDQIGLPITNVKKNNKSFAMCFAKVKGRCK